MAVSLGFGILFATFITMLLVPVNYMLMENGKANMKRFFSEFSFREAWKNRIRK
jgi:hypothetical protein